jgi:hypothetical protein
MVRVEYADAEIHPHTPRRSFEVAGHDLAIHAQPHAYNAAPGQGARQGGVDSIDPVERVLSVIIVSRAFGKRTRSLAHYRFAMLRVNYLK